MATPVLRSRAGKDKAKRKIELDKFKKSLYIATVLNWPSWCSLWKNVQGETVEAALNGGFRSYAERSCQMV
jgi:hypothetical protein